MQPYDTETGILHWDIPYEAGELTVEGCDAQGAVQATYRIHTSGTPPPCGHRARQGLLPPSRRGGANPGGGD